MRSVHSGGIDARRSDVPLVESLRSTKLWRECLPGDFGRDPSPIVRWIGQALDSGQLDFRFWEGGELWKDVWGG